MQQVAQFLGDEQFHAKHDAFHTQASNILAIANNVMASDKQVTIDQTKRIITMTYIAIVLFLAVGAVLGYFVGRHFEKPIHLIANRMFELAQGNFAVEPLQVKIMTSSAG